MKNLINLLVELRDTELKTTETKNGLTIQATQRNNLRKRIMDTLIQDLSEALSSELLDMGETTEGILLLAESGDYEIPIKINVKIGNLDYDGTTELELFQEMKLEKEKLAKEKELAKQEKIKRDKKSRQEKALTN